jgi:hypothetical protein
MTTNRITSSLALAGLLIAVSIGLAYVRRLGVVGAEAPARGAMVLTGILLAVYGNVIPKSVSRLSAKGESLQRVTGWATVISGLGYAAIWAFAPIGIAAEASMAAVIIGFACVLGYCAWLRRTADILENYDK